MRDAWEGAAAVDQIAQTAERFGAVEAYRTVHPN
jgi:hypothetical protein